MGDDGSQYSHETRHLLNNHIQITQIKLDNLDKTGADRHAALVDVVETKHSVMEAAVNKLESALKWAGGLIVSLMLTVLGWALVQQINANEAQKKDMQQQLDLLKAQEAQRMQYRQEVLSRLPAPGAPQPADTAVSDRQP